jgi:hypothetical protein
LYFRTYGSKLRVNAAVHRDRYDDRDRRERDRDAEKAKQQEREDEKEKVGCYH